MAFVGFHIDEGLSDKLTAIAVTEGGKSALMRRLVERAIGAGGQLRAAPVPSGSSCKVTIRLRQSELHQLIAMAADRGMNRTQWIAALVRSRIGAPIQHTSDERQALRAVARELNRIGGNINQIARAANIDRKMGRPATVSGQAIRDASAIVESALTELRQSLSRNASYWRGEP